MNICLLTDDEKTDIFKESRKYTQNDLLNLSILASANESYTKTILAYCLDNNNEMDRDVFLGLLHILTWLAEPLNAFFYEVGTWGNIPVFMKQNQGENEPAAEEEADV